jgi:hypothetical protein
MASNNKHNDFFGLASNNVFDHIHHSSKGVGWRWNFVIYRQVLYRSHGDCSMNHNAVFALYPQVVTARGDEAFDAQGNKVVIDMDAVNAWVDPNAYKYQRAQAYPSIADQLDLIYHEGIDAWKAQIAAVKQEYPKP